MKTSPKKTFGTIVAISTTLLIAVTLVSTANPAFAQGSGTWTKTGKMPTPLMGHTATLLQNGQVLASGGQYSKGTLTSVAALYDPVHGTWTVTGSMNTLRGGYTATVLQNGRVLVSGGTGSNLVALSSAELYDPATGKWTFTGSMTTPRANHSATLLNDGTVLVAT